MEAHSDQHFKLFKLGNLKHETLPLDNLVTVPKKFRNTATNPNWTEVHLRATTAVPRCE